MGSTDRIKNVARRVAKWHRAGHRMVVVVSAMSGETNRLIALAKEIMPNPDPRELDVIASTGEQVSIGLLAMALKAIGVEAVSYNGTQVGVHTDSAYTKARIESIDAGPIQSALDAGKVVIVAGILIFQDPRLREMLDIKIFVETDADVRILRRALRDVRDRGRTLESVITQYLTTVKPMHEQFVEPSRKYADIIVLEGGHNLVARDMIMQRIASHIAATD